MVVFGLAVVSALIRIYLWKFGSGYPAAYMRPDARADGLLIGAGAAFLWRWRWIPKQYLNEVAVVAFIGIIGTAFVIPAQSTVMFWGGFTVVSVAAAVVLLATAENAWALQPLMEAPWLRGLGRVSYGLYLWHALSLRIAFSVLKGHGPLIVGAVGLVITAAATTTSWYLVEQPFLRLKARFGRGPTPAGAGTVTPGGERPLRARNR